MLPYHEFGYKFCFTETRSMGRNGWTKRYLLTMALSLCKPQFSTLLYDK